MQRFASKKQKITTKEKNQTGKRRERDLLERTRENGREGSAELVFASNKKSSLEFPIDESEVERHEDTGSHLVGLDGRIVLFELRRQIHEQA